jgi:3-hydroxybutyryl-CoA dehydratase
MAVPLSVGDRATFRKTVGESDVYLFAGITGDLSPNHVDEVAMQRSPYGRRIAHGALIVGYMSAASTKILAHLDDARAEAAPVSVGYDRVRFLKPVFIGDTIEVRYQVKAIDIDRSRAVSDIIVVNQHNETVAVAQHILYFIPVSGKSTDLQNQPAERAGRAC